MHQISLGLNLDRGGAFAVSGRLALTAKNGAVLTDSASRRLMGRAARPSSTGIAPTTTAQNDLTRKDA